MVQLEGKRIEERASKSWGIPKMMQLEDELMEKGASQS